MVLSYRRANYSLNKYIQQLPLLMGFFIGVLSFYTYYLVLNYDCSRKIISVSPLQDIYKINNNHQQNYHRINFTKSSINNNISLFCLIFITNTDTVLMQHNIWIDKCGNKKLYVSKQTHKYIDHVVTDTYSSNPWRFYCQTLTYLYKSYKFTNIKYDWIFVAKDDVWLIYENLINLISILNIDKHKYNYYAGEYINGILNVDAGVLLSTNSLAALVNIFNSVDACNTDLSIDINQSLDFFMKKFNNFIPISNMDLYGCTLFHSISLFEAFNIKGLNLKLPKKCMSRSAITFQLDITSSYYAMFYKYILYKVRLVTMQDLMSKTNILEATSSKDKDIWRIEALYELNFDPSNMSQTDFFYHWSKKRKIIL